MPYKTGLWGEDARKRSARRRLYFRERYHKLHTGSRIRVTKPGRPLGIGKFGELQALLLLPGSRFIGHPCDIEWNGKLIDVKTSRIRPVRCRKKGRIYISTTWRFSLKQKGKVDYFLLIGLDDRQEVKRMLLVPDSAIKGTTTSVGLHTSQFDKYEIKRGELIN